MDEGQARREGRPLTCSIIQWSLTHVGGALQEPSICWVLGVQAEPRSP